MKFTTAPDDAEDILISYQYGVTAITPNVFQNIASVLYGDTTELTITYWNTDPNRQWWVKLSDSGHQHPRGSF